MQIVSALALGMLISHAIVASDLLAQLAGTCSRRIPRKLSGISLRGREREDLLRLP